MTMIAPAEGFMHVGCPDCGMVTTVPLDRLEPPPWCVHNGTTYVWRDPHPDTQEGTGAWTRTTPVVVIEDEPLPEDAWPTWALITVCVVVVAILLGSIATLLAAGGVGT